MNDDIVAKIRRAPSGRGWGWVVVGIPAPGALSTRSRGGVAFSRHAAVKAAVKALKEERRRARPYPWQTIEVDR